MIEAPRLPPFSALRRMRGVFLRHYRLWIGNPEYFFDTFWQPVVEVFIWGFVSFYLSRMTERLGGLVAFFLGAVILWAILRRAQHEITFSLMEEAWSRNLQNILITPVSAAEYFASSIAFCVVKLAVELILMASLVALLFGFNVLVLGAAIVPFAASLLLTGWAIGLFVNAAIIFFGRGLVALSWIMAFVLQPFACVFYPLSALPAWAKPLAMSFPATWVFEGLRAILDGAPLPWNLWALSMALNAVYLLAGYGVFNAVMRTALDKGLMMRLEW